VGGAPLAGDDLRRPEEHDPRSRDERAGTCADRCIDAGVFAFAAFTLGANATVALGGSLADLTVFALCMLLVTFGGAAWWWRMRGPRAIAPPGEPVASNGVQDAVPAGTGAAHAWADTLPPREQAVLTLWAIAGAAGTWMSGSLWPAWLCTASVSAWVLVRSMREAAPIARHAGSARGDESARGEASARGDDRDGGGPGDAGDEGSRSSSTIRPGFGPARTAPSLLVALAALCAATVAVAHRANDDDAFYLNIAVAAADAPQAALLAGDTLHGYDGVPIGLPVFRVLAYEPAIAVLSRLTGVDALVLAQVVLPPLFALLIPFAWARLLRRLAPREWPWLLVGVVASFYLLADGRATHGEFALLRMQQGKSILLVVLWPLLADSGVRFGRAPDAMRWLRLASTQIAAVGLTTNALWLAPVIGGLGVCAGVLDGRRPETDASLRSTAAGAIRVLVPGALASFHAVGWALWLRAETLQTFREAAHPLPSLAFSAQTFMAEALEIVAGHGLAAALTLFAVTAAAALAPTRSLRRFIAIYTVATALLFWSPLHAHLVATQITGPDTYFRVLWIWPLPIAFAVILASGVGLLARAGRGGLAVRIASFAALAALVFVAGGHMLTVSPANGVRLGVPAVKIDPGELRVARAVARHAGPGDFVLAPVAPSRWIPLLHDHPHPLVVREMLLDVLTDRFDQRELTLRAQLTRMVGGEVRLPHSGKLLAHAIESIPLQAVALQGAARGYDDVIEALEASPLVRVESNDAFEIWARSDIDE
jgi:hypothetical protein